MSDDLTPAQYFRHYRTLLGFSNQADAKKYLGAKDIVAAINYAYIDDLLQRLIGIIHTYDKVIVHAPKPTDLDTFLQAVVSGPYKTIKDEGLLPRLNNQGRRPEHVLFSWLRGYATAEYFLPALMALFQGAEFKSIGDDDFTSLETFKRTPKADYELRYHNQRLRVEIQSGYQGINDIKQHKVLESKKVFQQNGTPTICVHLDIFNGQAAFLRLDTIAEDDNNWITRQQMEGQTVLAIDQNSFQWRLTNPLPALDHLDLGL